MQTLDVIPKVLDLAEFVKRTAIEDDFDELIPDLVWRDVEKPWKFEPDFGRTPSLRGRGLGADSLDDIEAAL